MFMNLTSKQRFFLNMVLSQIGFAAISTVAILSDHKISAIIAVNIVFAIIVGYITQLSHLKPSSFPVTSLNRSIMAVKFSFLLTTSSILAISSKIAKNACIAIAKV